MGRSKLGQPEKEPSLGPGNVGQSGTCHALGPQPARQGHPVVTPCGRGGGEPRQLGDVSVCGFNPVPIFLPFSPGEPPTWCEACREQEQMASAARQRAAGPPPPPGAPAMTEQGSELAPQGTQMSSPHARSDGTFIAGNWTKLSRSNVLTPGWLLLWQQRGGHATGNSMKLGPAGCSGALPQAPGWLHSQSCAQGGGGEPSALGSCVAVKAESNQHPANLSATQGIWTEGLGASPPCNCWLVLFMYLFIKSAGSFPK